MRESPRDRRIRSFAARVGQDSGRSAPCVQPNTPDGHHRENVRSGRDVLPRSVQFSVATNVRFSVAIDGLVHHRRRRRQQRLPGTGLVSRCPPPGGLYDGDDEASRVPGKPTRTHATRSDPGEVSASTASETRRDDLPSNARRRPSPTIRSRSTKRRRCVTRLSWFHRPRPRGCLGVGRGRAREIARSRTCGRSAGAAGRRRPAPISRRGWRMRSFGTNRFSGIGFAPGPEAGEWPSPWSRVTS